MYLLDFTKKLIQLFNYLFKKKKVFKNENGTYDEKEILN